jgi:hypothetical protein
MNRYKYIDENKTHLHTLDNQPLYGTSSVGNIIAKPLTWYASGMALMELGWTKIRVDGVMVPIEQRIPFAATRLEYLKTLTPEAFLKLLDKAYRAHDENKKEKADEGTDRHAELEKYVKHCIENGIPKGIATEKPHIKALHEWAKNNVKRFLWSELHTYSEALWVGGIVDAGVEMNDGTIAVIDFKSSKEAYYTQFLQCGGYAIQLEESGGYDPDGNKIFELGGKVGQLIVFPFGAKEPNACVRYDVDKFKQAFVHALELTKHKNSYENA